MQARVTVRVTNILTEKKKQQRGMRSHILHLLIINGLFSVKHFPLVEHSMVLLRPAVAATSGFPGYSYFQETKVHVFSSIGAYTGIFLTKGFY